MDRHTVAGTTAFAVRFENDFDDHDHDNGDDFDDDDHDNGYDFDDHDHDMDRHTVAGTTAFAVRFENNIWVELTNLPITGECWGWIPGEQLCGRPGQAVRLPAAREQDYEDCWLRLPGEQHKN